MRSLSKTRSCQRGDDWIRGIGSFELRVLAVDNIFSQRLRSIDTDIHVQINRQITMEQCLVYSIVGRNVAFGLFKTNACLVRIQKLRK